MRWAVLATGMALLAAGCGANIDPNAPHITTYTEARRICDEWNGVPLSDVEWNDALRMEGAFRDGGLSRLDAAAAAADTCNAIGPLDPACQRCFRAIIDAVWSDG